MSSQRPDALVECHSGFTYAERPTRLFWQGEWLTIEDIQKQWRIPGGKKFQVITEDQRTFELFYGELYDEWRIHEL
ncbi:MAG: hypothetical protein ACLFWD_03300 [Anaerolineales bacterium]